MLQLYYNNYANIKGGIYMDRSLFITQANHSAVPENAKKIFEALKTVSIYNRNDTIYRQGESAECFYYLKKGKVKIFFNSPDGMEKTLSIAGTGSLLGEAAFFDKIPRISSAKAEDKCEIISINGKKLIELIGKHPNLAMDLLQILAKRIRLLSSQIDSMTFLQADARIAQLLLEYKTEENNMQYIYLTHEEIGNMVGVSRVTVSKILNNFAREKIIKTNYKSIQLLNIEKLENIITK